jgi:hypothetical protein
MERTRPNSAGSARTRGLPCKWTLKQTKSTTCTSSNRSRTKWRIDVNRPVLCFLGLLTVSILRIETCTAAAFLTPAEILHCSQRKTRLQVQSLPNPFSNDDAAATPVPPPFDGTTEEGLIQQAQRVVQADLGLADSTLLDNERFVWIGPNVDVPLSKTDYLAAGRFFNLRGAFPDWNWRAHDFRLVRPKIRSNTNDNETTRNTGTRTVRCTCRVTGTMRGELRLRSGVLAPTGNTLIGPPEAVSIALDVTTGRVVKLCTGFVLDRLVGNTMGTAGVQAASIIAGEPLPPWELLPLPKVVSNVFARPVAPIMEKSNDSPPFPETVLIQLAKGVLNTGLASQDPTLLSDKFTFVTPTIGPIGKRTFLESYAAAELARYTNPNLDHYRIDPYDPERVWVDLEQPTSDNYVGPPQAMSLTFDSNGYCTRLTSWAVMDPTLGNAGGLGGPEGVAYAKGQARWSIWTRPWPRVVGRLGIRLLSPLTGVSVDSATLPQPRRPVSSTSGPAAVRRPSVTRAKPTSISTSSFTTRSPVRPSLPPPESIIANRFANTVTANTTKIDNAVVARLDKLKDFASSIRIIPSEISKSFPLLPTLNNDSQSSVADRKMRLTSGSAARGSKSAAQPERQRTLGLNAALAPRRAQQLAVERGRQDAAAKRRQQEQAQQAEADRQRKEKQRQAAQAAARKAQMERMVLERQKAAEARQREQQAQARRATAEAAARVRLAEMERVKRRDTEQKRAAEAVVARQEQANKAERDRKVAVLQRRDVEARQKVADTREQQQQAEQRRREVVAKAKLAAAATRAADQKKAGPNAPPPTNRSPSFGLAQATISLFGLGKNELEELPAAKATPAVKRAPMGVPTLRRWRKNSDSTISGLVFGSRAFDDNARITTSPITKGVVTSGEVVRTGSGSQYFLE